MSSFCLFAQETKFVPPDGISFRFTGVEVYSADDLDRLWNMAFDHDFKFKRFFPIGWSENGNFAYMTHSISDTVNGYFYDLYVINLVDDLIVFEDYLSLTDNDSDYERAEAVLENKFHEWNLLIKRYNIEGTIESPGHGTTIEKFPLRLSNWNYDLYYESQNTDKECNWQLILRKANNNNITQKIISTGKIENSYEMNSILGYYKSPFEDRIATIICRETRARSIGFSIFGAHLNVGFK
jgi:hypothetical protein